MLWGFKWRSCWGGWSSIQMGYRKKDTKEWKKWCQTHKDRLNTIGIPKNILETQERWELFLEHSYDVYDKDNIFTIELLTKKEATEFSYFLFEIYEEEYISLIKELKIMYGLKIDWMIDF